MRQQHNKQGTAKYSKTKITNKNNNKKNKIKMTMVSNYKKHKKQH